MSDNSDHKKVAELSWKILRAKYHYYIKDNPIMSDYEYDMMEREYDNLCNNLGIKPTASDMVGFDIKRPSCQLVAAKAEGMSLETFNRVGFGFSEKEQKKMEKKIGKHSTSTKGRTSKTS